MPRAPKALVQPSVLEWLRMASGLSIDETARKLQTNPDNLIAWEAGDDRPSMPQLRKLAKAYKRPISYFYLPKPVGEPSIPHDFRRLPGEDERHYSPALLHEIRTAYRRRSVAIDLGREAGRELLDFDAIGTATLENNPEEVATHLRKLVGVTFAEQSSWRESRRAYNGWRSGIEALGVLVFQITTVELSQMLGFSLAYRELPVIGINRKLKPNGRTFTLLHEFTHLLLGEGGVCDIDDTLPRAPQEQRVEVFCNHVAGAAMVPQRELLGHDLVRLVDSPQEWSNDALALLSREFGASEEVVLRRLLIHERTTQEFYARKRAEYQARNARLAQQEREQTNEMRRNMAREAVSNLSGFARIVIDSYHSDIINLTEASRYLGVRAEKVAAVDNLVR